MDHIPLVTECNVCGKKYQVSGESVGRHVRCRSCGNEFVVAAAEQIPELLSNEDLEPEYTAEKLSDEIDYQIFGDDTQYAEITLDPDEQVVAEAGAMMYMTANIRMDTVMGNPAARGEAGGGFWSKVAAAGKRVVTGESLFMTTFTNLGSEREVVSFAAPYPGRILAMDLHDVGGEIICQKGAFLCGARGLQIGIAFRKKILVGLFGGEGFVMQRIQGDGIALLHAGGTMRMADLVAGETLRIDTGCLVALQPSVEYSVELVGGIKNTFFGGEGLFLATLRGPGRVWLQSLPFSRLAGRIAAAIPRPGSSRKGEGSLLDMVGGLGNLLDGD